MDLNRLKHILGTFNAEKKIQFVDRIIYCKKKDVKQKKRINLLARMINSETFADDMRASLIVVIRYLSKLFEWDLTCTRKQSLNQIRKMYNTFKSS